MRRRELAAINIEYYDVIFFLGLFEVVPGVVNDNVHFAA